MCTIMKCKMCETNICPSYYQLCSNCSQKDCTTYTLITATSDRCLICGKLKWEHE